MPPSPTLRRGAATVLAAFACLLSPIPAPSASAGDPAEAAPGGAAPGARKAPRLCALDSEIRVLEQRLQVLRRVRADVNAGRGETLPADEGARKAHERAVRALREVQRYEAARGKAVAGLVAAIESKDEARAAAARSALSKADDDFVAAMERIDDDADAAKKPDGRGADPAPKKASKRAVRSSEPAGSAGSGTGGDEADDE